MLYTITFPTVVLAREIVTPVNVPRDMSKLGSAKLSVNGMPCCGVLCENVSLRDSEKRDDAHTINPKVKRTERLITGCKLLSMTFSSVKR